MVKRFTRPSAFSRRGGPSRPALKAGVRGAEYSGERTRGARTDPRPLNGKDEAMMRFICSRCLRLWDAAAVAHRGTCPFCGGALDDTPR
jgi:hypothetical protein